MRDFLGDIEDDEQFGAWLKTVREEAGHYGTTTTIVYPPAPYCCDCTGRHNSLTGVPANQHPPYACMLCPRHEASRQPPSPVLHGPAVAARTPEPAAAVEPPPASPAAAAPPLPALPRAVAWIVKAIEADHFHRPMSPEVAAALREAKALLGV